MHKTGYFALETFLKKVSIFSSSLLFSKPQHLVFKSRNRFCCFIHFFNFLIQVNFSCLLFSTNLHSSSLLNFFCYFSGLSPVRIKSKDAIEVSKSTTLHCDYYLDNLGEQLYSVLWYWTPSIKSVDFRRWEKSGLVSKPEIPTKAVQFFRYRKIDPDGTRKKAWDHNLRGIFDVNVSENFYISFFLEF